MNRELPRHVTPVADNSAHCLPPLRPPPTLGQIRRRELIEEIGSCVVLFGCIGAIIGLGAITQAILDGWAAGLP